MKTFIARMILFIPLMTLILAVEMIADPAHFLRRDSYARGVAVRLLNGDNVAGTVNFDARLLQKDYIEGLTKSSDIIVLGSSRSMKIRSGFFPNKSLFNHSVPIGGLEEFIAISQLYHERQFRPSTVILGLDPWILNRNFRPVLWKTLHSEYSAGAKRLNLSPDDSSILDFKLSQVSELISPTLVQESFLYVIDGLTSRKQSGVYYSTSDRSHDYEQIILSDGSVVAPETQRINEVTRSHLDALTYPKKAFNGSFLNFSEIAPERAKQLESLVDSFQQEGTQVVFFLAPFHPEAYRGLVTDERGRILTEVQKYLTDLANRKNITIFGSFNPADCSCADGEFLDAQHPDDSCIKRIFGSAPLMVHK